MDRKPGEQLLSSILENLNAWFRKPAPVRRPKSRQRSLGLESLEGRRVMSATPGALIQGTVYNDATGSSSTGVGIQGATVKLYQDGGDGVYEGSAGGSDDTLIGTATTNSAGVYTFSNLGAGTYWVVENSVPSGYVAENAAPQEITISSSAALGTVLQTIDDFSSSQAVTAASNGVTTSASTIAAPGALGGYRNLYSQLSSSYGEIDLSSNAFSQGLLEYNSSATGYGTRYVAWDGNNSANPAVVNYSGLGGVDLTSGGKSTGLELNIGADHNNGTVTVIIYTDANDYSMATVTVPNTGGAATGSVYIPFTSFTLGGGAGANFSKVGAMVMKITGNAAVNGQVSSFTDVGPSAFNANFAAYRAASVGTFVFVDGNHDGLRDNGEAGDPNVTVDLMKNGAVVASTTTNAQGVYSFTGLAPGTYSVQFLAPNGSKLTSELVGGNSAVNSDADPSTGISPTFTLTSGQNLTSVDAGVLPIDLTVTKSVSNSTPQLNGNVTFTINVANLSGYSQATDVAVSDLLPAGLTYVSGAASQGSYNSATGAWSVGTVASGASATLTVVATVSTAGAKTNVATITGADETDVATASQLSSSASVTPVLPADLQITKSVNNSTPDVGANVTFTITVSDTGPGAATNVVATDKLPSGLTYVSSSASQGTYNSTSGVWTVGAVNVGATPPSLTIVATVTTAATVTNTATITSLTQIDLNLANNIATATVTPQEPTDDLVVTKSVDNPLPTTGQDVTFTITAGDYGPSTSTHTTATDLLPAGLTFVSYTASQGTYNATTGLWSIGSLYASATPVTLTIVAEVTQVGLITNTVTITSDQTDTDPTDNTASAIVVGSPPTTTHVVITPPPPPTPAPSKYNYLGR